MFRCSLSVLANVMFQFIRFSLVAVGGVESEVGDDFSGVSGVDDGFVVDEGDDLGAGVGSADTEVQELP